jgi:Mn2+/Fe2+ NRAMP family transporter
LLPRARPRLGGLATRLAFLSVVGPGLVSGFADNDAGGITTYSIAGAQFGYDLMWALLASMLALAVTQEIGARLGLATGQGLGGLLRQRFGVRWTPCSQCCSPTSVRSYPSLPGSPPRCRCSACL